MKNSKLRIVAIITAVALVLTTCGLSSFVFADNVPEPVILNNCSGVGTNTFGWIDGSFYKTSTVVNDSSDGKGLILTALQAMTQANIFSLKVNPKSETNLPFKGLRIIIINKADEFNLSALLK